MRLRNVTRNLEEGQRRYHKRKFGCNSALAQPSTLQPSTVQPLDDEDLSEWMSIIKRMKPSSENMAPIKTAMEETFSHRRNWISTKSPTVADIVQHYPRFIDIPSLVSLFLIDTSFPPVLCFSSKPSLIGTTSCVNNIYEFSFKGTVHPFLFFTY